MPSAVKGAPFVLAPCVSMRIEPDPTGLLKGNRNWREMPSGDTLSGWRESVPIGSSMITRSWVADGANPAPLTVTRIPGKAAGGSTAARLTTGDGMTSIGTEPVTSDRPTGSDTANMSSAAVGPVTVPGRIVNVTGMSHAIDPSACVIGVRSEEIRVPCGNPGATMPAPFRKYQTTFPIGT